MRRIEGSEYLKRYWSEIVLPGLAREVENPDGAAGRLAFAWRLTRDDVYARAAERNLAKMLAESPPNMLHRADHIISVVTALSWLDGWPGIRSDQMEHAEAAIANMIETMAAHFAGGNFGTLELNRSENWDAQIIAALGIGACFLRRHPRRGQWLKQAEMSAVAWLDRRKGDGGLCEGTINYHLYALSNMCRLAEVLREHERTDLFAHEGLRKMFEFVVYTLAPDGRVPGFNDSERTNFQKRNGSDVLLLKGGLEYQDPMFLWGYRRVRDDFPDYYECFPHVVLYYPDDEKAEAPCRAGSMVFPYVGWVSMRNGWGRDGTHLVLKAGPWGGWHDHFDRSTFELVGKGVALAVDAGCGSYGDRMDWFRRSEAHNLVMVNGRDQCPGDSRIVRFQSSDVADYALADCRRALRGPDGGDAVGYLRQVLYAKRDDWFVFHDTISGAKECEWLLHSRGELTVEGRQALWATAEGVRLSARFLDPKVAIARKSGQASDLERLVWNQAADKVDYISAKPCGSESEFIVLLEPLLPKRECVRVETVDIEGGYFRIHSGPQTTHLRVMRGGRTECRGELEFKGVAALIAVQEGRWRELALVGATHARLDGELLFDSPEPADIALERNGENALTGKLRVRGELFEVPILTCDGYAASIFQERSSPGNVEVAIGLPRPPREIFLSGKPVSFRCVPGENAVRFFVETIGEEYSLAINGENAH
ncbi:MAG: heparinase II/III family protein [Verrucomicrobia bacterium]|nr:heparinase II/III family protein [Verrucomicrobiota bacterium]MBU4248307.1 heparinase II/III family protein [Verrucomicrobiota bacterium]MBU4289834.1 heparinase II/III family protein [Verrucomicrobiota bacterium]MBU4429507.1 heparinase II/III family protein [Verrucomicrobiota bacterium]MBU4496772.1 heparinase II/III family protein [Verrucomicrobiota bacterium]